MQNTSLGLTFPRNETYFSPGYPLFFTGESFNDVYGPGHVYSAILGILTVIVSMVGLVGNCLILKVFHLKKEETSFKTLVVGLAYVDIACIVGSMVIPIRDLGVPFGWLTHESFSHIMFIRFGYMLYAIQTAIITVLTYTQVLGIQNGRRASSLSNQERLPLQPAKMFLPSLVLMLLSNCMFLAEGIHIEATGIRYVEIWMTCAMFTALNSSMNFLFFYWNSTDFQTQVDVLVEKYKYKTKQRSNHVETGV